MKFLRFFRTIVTCNIVNDAIYAILFCFLCDAKVIHILSKALIFIALYKFHNYYIINI